MSVDLQLQLRRNVEQVNAAVEDLDGWLGDIGKRDAQLRGVAAPTGSRSCGAADDGTDDEDEAREIEEAKEELRKLAAAQEAEAAGTAKPDNGRSSMAAMIEKSTGKVPPGFPSSAPDSTPAKKGKGPLTHAQKYGQWDQYDADGIVQGMEAKEADQERLRKEVVRLENRRAQSQARKKSAAAAAATEALRLQGNEAFGAARYEEAVGMYTDALGHSPRSAVLYANRALALLKLHANAEAEEDCEAALLIEPAHVKALLRRAQARHAMAKYDLALDDLESALEQEPRNAAARSLMAECRRLKALAMPRPKPALARLAIEQVDHDPDNDSDAFVLAIAQTTEEANPPATSATPAALAAAGSAVADMDAAGADTTEIEASPSRAKEMSAPRLPRGLPTTTPTADSFPLPTTLAEMERVWRSLRGNLSEFALFIRRVEPSRLEVLFRNNLPAEIFTALLASIDGHFVSHEAPRALAILRALTTAGRFSILTMCLDNADRKAIDSINIKLIEAQGRGDLSADEDLEALRKAYA